MRVKTSSSWFKVLAVCTAVGLGGNYVWRQQQSVAPQNDKAVEPAALPDSTSKSVAPTPLPADYDESDPFAEPISKSADNLTLDQERTLMPSSKIGIIDLKPEEKEERVLMPGSKSLTIRPRVNQTTPPPANPKVEEP